LQSVPEACIYHHTHHFLLQHHYLTPGPPNDFAYWVTEVLGEEPLGEWLAGIDAMEHTTLQGLREAFVSTIQNYLSQNAIARMRFASEGQEFFFMKSIHLVMPTPYIASTLAEFADALQRVSIHSLYFHLFDARLRLGRRTNDFAVWLEEQLGLKPLSEAIATIDPYAYTLETVRSILLAFVRHQLDAAGATHAEPR
jgi:hypothetical protein